jgi:hypothetical protein
MRTNAGRLSRFLPILLAAAVLAASSACSSTKGPKDPGLGVRVLDAVVVERGQDAPSRSSGYSSGSGMYYLVFETREGDATARYRFEVTRQQWFRFQEGARVRVTLNNNILQDIRPNNQP